jgi:hypothetical protein
MYFCFRICAKSAHLACSAAELLHPTPREFESRSRLPIRGDQTHPSPFVLPILHRVSLNLTVVREYRLKSTFRQFVRLTSDTLQQLAMPTAIAV